MSQRFIGVLLFVILAVLLSSMVPSFSYGANSQCQQRNSNSFPGAKELSLAKESFCNLGSSSSGCIPVMQGKQEVVCIVALLTTKSRVYGQRCIRGLPNSDSDDFDEFYSEFKWDTKNKKMNITKVELEGFTNFSNPSYCESLIAFWGIGHKKDLQTPVSAVVYDLETQKKIIASSLGSALMETDNSGHFPRPEWKSKSEVLFKPPKTESILKERTINIGK